MANNEVKLKLSVDGANAVLSDFDKVRSGMSGVSDAATTAAGAMRTLGAAFSVGAVVAWGKAMIDAADAMNDMSQRVGIAVKDLAKYQLATSQSGTNMESLSKGIKGLAGNLIDHGAALKKAGIDTTNADTAMQSLADVFASMPDGVEKTNLAVKLFGKSGMDLIPMLNLGSSGLQTATEKSAAYAAQMAAMAPMADEFNDNLAQMSLNSKSLGMTMLNEMMPSLIKVSEAMTAADETGTSLASLFGQGLKIAFQSVALIASDVVFVFKGIGREIGGIAAQVVAAATGNWKGFSAISDAMKSDAAKARDELDRFQDKLVNGTTKIQDAYNKRRGFGYEAKSNASGKAISNALGSDDKVATAALNKELEAQARLLAELSGLSGNFTQDWDRLSAMYAKGTLNLNDLTAAQAVLLAKQPAIKAGLDEEKKARDELLKTRDAELKAHATELTSLGEKAQKLEDEVAMYGMSKEAIEELTTARMQDRIEVLKGFDNSGEEIARIEQVIAARKRLATAGAALDAKDASKKAAEQMANDQKKAAEESEKYWTDALMRAFESGKGFFESLWDTIKNTLKTEVLQVAIRATMGSMGLGAAGAASAAGVPGAGGSGGSLLGTASTLSNLYSMVSGGLNAGLQGGLQVAKLVGEGAIFAGNATVAGFAGGMMSTSSMAAATAAAQAGGAQAAGLIAGSFGNGMTGYAIANAISGGYELGSVNTIAGLVSMIPGVGPIAGVVGGLITRAFGHGPLQMTGQGTRGTFGADNTFSGTNYANYHRDGGWFSSDINTTDYSAIDPATVTAWSTAFAGVKGSVAGMAASLGLATTQISAYSKAVDIAAGTTAEQLTAIFTGMADDMALAAAPSLAQFAKTGEVASTTLARLSGSLQTVNMWLGTLDHTLLAVSLSGGDAASKLADAFGGLDAMATASKAYYDLFWTDAERLADTATNVAKGLALVSVAMPASKEAFRDVVSGLDLTTDAGRNTYAVMLALAPEFAQVADAAQTAAAAATKLMTDVFDTLQSKLTSLVDSIASERAAVASASTSLLGIAPKTAAQLAAEIAGAKVALPSDAGVLSALQAKSAAQAGATAAQTTLQSSQSAQAATGSTYGGAITSAQGGLASTVDYYKTLASYFQNTASAYALRVYATDASKNDAYSYNASTNQMAGWGGTADATTTGRSYGDFLADMQRFKDAMYGNGTIAALNGGNTALANAAQAIVTAQNAYNTAMANATATTASAATAVTTANANLAAADAAAKTALLDYAAAMTQYSGDAEKAVKVLSTLREETVAYYQTQKELAGLMSTSAATLRSAVRSSQFGQLSSTAALAQQQADFARNYSLALSTSGATKAGYADNLSAALPGLSSALMDTSSTRSAWALATAKLYTQSETIAAQLATDAAGMNYEAESLSLLGSIDVALGELDTNTAILKNAIDGGTATSAAGLRAIVTQLGGVPTFASGGLHAGGLRVVGENGPELEVTGPSRIFNASQTRGLLQGGGTSNQELVNELRALRQSNENMRAELRAIATAANKTAKILGRVTQDGESITTTVLA